MTIQYDFEHEAKRLIAAIEPQRGAAMTVLCALHEAYDAGKDAGAAALSRQIEDRKPEVSQPSAALSQPSRQLSPAEHTDVLAAVNAGRWTRTQCGNCGATYRRCARCGQGVKGAEREGMPCAAGHSSDLPCSSDCIATIAETILRESAALVPQGWREIATAPMDGTDVLLLAPGGRRDLGRYHSADNLRRSVHGAMWRYRRSMSPGYDARNQPTHWMPLPAPPLSPDPPQETRS